MDDKYLKKLEARYRVASKQEKTGILGEFVKTTGYHRKNPAAVLNGRQETRLLGPAQSDGEMVITPSTLNMETATPPDRTLAFAPYLGEQGTLWVG